MLFRSWFFWIWESKVSLTFLFKEISNISIEGYLLIKWILVDCFSTCYLSLTISFLRASYLILKFKSSFDKTGYMVFLWLVGVPFVPETDHALGVLLINKPPQLALDVLKQPRVPLHQLHLHSALLLGAVHDLFIIDDTFSHNKLYFFGQGTCSAFF